MTERVDVRVPLAHVAEQALHSDHALTWQFTGQGRLLQVCVRVKSGHAVPPCAGFVTTERDWVCEPPPHASEQVVQADQGLTAQFTGHGRVLQGRFSASVGHPAPPKADAVETRRERDCVPPPQVTEHAEYSDQDVTTQSTGQFCVLHDWARVKAGHLLPPLAGAVTTARVCVCEPPPQDLLHADH